MKLMKKCLVSFLVATMTIAPNLSEVKVFAADSLSGVNVIKKSENVGAANTKHVIDFMEYDNYEEKQKGDYIYIEYNDNTVGIVSYLGNSKNIIFPAQISGKTVSCVGVIGNVVDWDLMEDVVSISLPDSVDTIGNYSFSYLTNLERIDFSNRVTYIGEGAFSGCTKLQSIPLDIVADSISYVGSSAFFGTAWFDNQSDGVIYVGDIAYTFKGTIPQHIDIKHGTVTITQLAFAAPGFAGLKSISIPETVTEIFEKSCGYTFSMGSGYTKIDGFTIYGKKNSAAEKYANENNFSFIQSESAMTFGDLDGDGLLNASDRAYLTRYLAKWENYSKIDVQAADYNSDGIVNTKDRIVLTRHLANWKGYETLPVNNI